MSSCAPGAQSTRTNIAGRQAPSAPATSSSFSRRSICLELCRPVPVETAVRPIRAMLRRATRSRSRSSSRIEQRSAPGLGRRQVNTTAATERMLRCPQSCGLILWSRGGHFQFAPLVLGCPSRQVPVMPVVGDADVDMGLDLVAGLVDVSHLAVIGPALAFETVKLLQGGIIDVINLAGNDKRWEPEVNGVCHRKDSGIARASIYRESQQRQRLLR